jgi:hypothetical protein
MEEIECNVRGKLEAILAEHVSRMLASGAASSKDIVSAMDLLRLKRLMPENVESDLCKELKNICTRRFEQAMPESNRLDGFGWSKAHIKEHMKRMLTAKLQEITTILRSTKS